MKKLFVLLIVSLLSNTYAFAQANVQYSFSGQIVPGVNLNVSNVPTYTFVPQQQYIITAPYRHHHNYQQQTQVIIQPQFIPQQQYIQQQTRPLQLVKICGPIYYIWYNGRQTPMQECHEEWR